MAAPRGDFVLDDGAEPVLLISAGIGVTPVLAMLHQLAAGTGTREVWWLYGARRPQDQPLATEAHALLGSLPHAHEHVYYSQAPDIERHPGASAGRLTKDKLAGLGLPAHASAYICGPDSFMADMRQALTTLGVGPDRIHTELFGALAGGQPRADRADPAATAPAARAGRHRPDGDVRAQRRVHPVRRGLAQRARPGRRLRRAHPVELPDRGLPHLRDAAAVRPGGLPPGPARTARRGPGTDLLRPAQHRSRTGHVRGTAAIGYA